MTLQRINSNFSNIIKAFTRTKQKVFNKFLGDAIWGIILSKSLNLSAMARELEINSNSGVSARHIFKRLDRNLGFFDTHSIKEKAQAKQISLVDENTLIYFDPTDITKKYGKKFEALSRIPDGSNDHKTEKGYPVVACVALKKDEVIPIDFSLFSYKEEAFESENQKFLYHIDTIAYQSKFKGTFVLDRGFDRFAIFRHLHENSINFITRLQKTRYFYLPGKYAKSFSREELMKIHAQVKIKALIDLRIKKRLIKKAFTIKATTVELFSGKIDSDKPLTLIRAWASNTLTLYLLTNRQNLSAEDLIQIVQDYLNRWKVEEFIRFTKHHYGAEKFKVLSLGRIKNLLNLLFLSIVILTRLGELDLKFSKTRAILIRKARRTYKLPQKMKFFLYSMADGLSEILKITPKKILQLWTSPPKNQLQLSIEAHL